MIPKKIPSVKRAIKLVLPYAAVVAYKNRKNEGGSAQDPQMNIDSIGQLSEREALNLLSQEGSQIYFGQSAEDSVLSRIFLRKKKGFYVDIGAYHPSKYSNTFLFHKYFNWRGINIDASDNSIRAFNSARPNDINLNLAIGSEEGTQELTVYSQPACNTLSDENKSMQKKRDQIKIVDTKTVDVMPLDKVLDEYLPKKTHIDILDIDIEGYDLQALETNNWSKYRPSVILIEDYTINTEGLSKSKIHKFMNKIDYRFFSHTYDTSVYVDNKQDVGRV